MLILAEILKDAYCTAYTLTSKKPFSPMQGLEVAMEKNTWVQAFCAFGGCIEVLEGEDGSRRIRSSRDRAVEIRVSRDEWEAFATAVREGKLD